MYEDTHAHYLTTLPSLAERCDALSSTAAQRSDLPNDIGYLPAQSPRSTAEETHGRATKQPSHDTQAAHETNEPPRENCDYHRGRQDALSEVLPKLEEIQNAACDDYPDEPTSASTAYLHYYDGLLDDLSDLQSHVRSRLADIQS